MIKSILDNDLYKFTMQQAVWQLYPYAEAEYTFVNRRPANFMTDSAFVAKVNGAIQAMGELSLTHQEYDFLTDVCPFLKPLYLEGLKNHRFTPDDVSISAEDGEFSLKVAGPWYRTILWEVPLLAIISEAYFETVDTDWHHDGQAARAREKGERLSKNGVKFADFGTRRRRSYFAHNVVVNELKNTSGFVGTSNVHLAHTHGLRPKGTTAHEWTQGISVLEGMRHANRSAMDRWAQVYEGDLGIALTDTFGSQAFWDDFSTGRAKAWDGVRHDSGCPFAFADKAISHYENLGIDPVSKIAIFSDSLNTEKAIAVTEHCDGRLGNSCGIGTHFTNDFDGSPALNIVIKLTQMNGIHTVKLSDDAGKEIGDPEAVKVAKWVFGR